MQHEINWVQCYVRMLPKHTPFRSFIIENDLVYVQVKPAAFKKLIREAWTDHCLKVHDDVSSPTLWEFLNKESKLDRKSIAIFNFGGHKPEFYFKKDKLPQFVSLVHQIYPTRRQKQDNKGFSHGGSVVIEV